MIKTRLISSLEKVMLGNDISDFAPMKRVSALRGERLSVQLIHTYVYQAGIGSGVINRVPATLTVEGELAAFTTLRDVGNVPVERPVLQGVPVDEDYISFHAGLFPDLLRPLHYGNTVICTPDALFSVWVTVEIPESLAAGVYELTLRLDGGEGNLAEEHLSVEVIDAVLLGESIYLTQWFHCDCLASYYHVEMWSERHWEIIENFARTAVKNGINMLLTPVFTPPLDTTVGGERPTAQLVGVTKTGETYTFDFSLLDRWIEMCDRIGVQYFEIAHFFTQWGAEHAPKIMATVEGVYKQIFGWDTDATGDEYTTFLQSFLTEFLAHMKKNGNDKRCFFHVSDEPREKHLESYRAARAVVSELLKDYTIMDALSNYVFWKDGVVSTPIPSNKHIAPFIEGRVPNLWTYYCCSETQKVSNRLIAMPSWRNRSIGFQMYKYDIVGFLQWGYNFYYNRQSGDLINPYLQQDGDAWVPAGDAFSVYPAPNGEALESLRIAVFYDALQDMRAMRLCEQYCGKDAVVAVIDEEIGTDVTFDTCAKNAAQILKIRERVNEMLRQAVKTNTK